MLYKIYDFVHLVNFIIFSHVDTYKISGQRNETWTNQAIIPLPLI